MFFIFFLINLFFFDFVEICYNFWVVISRYKIGKGVIGLLKKWVFCFFNRDYRM